MKIGRKKRKSKKKKKSKIGIFFFLIEKVDPNPALVVGPPGGIFYYPIYSLKVMVKKWLVRMSAGISVITINQFTF